MILRCRRKAIKGCEGRINDEVRRFWENSRLSLPSDPLCNLSLSPSFSDSGGFTSTHETRHRNLNRVHTTLQGHSWKCVCQYLYEAASVSTEVADAQRHCAHTENGLSFFLLVNFVCASWNTFTEHRHMQPSCCLGLEPAGLSLQRSRWWATLCLAWNLPFFQPQGTSLGVLLN